jgi:hypothetical protein
MPTPALQFAPEIAQDSRAAPKSTTAVATGPPSSRPAGGDAGRGPAGLHTSHPTPTLQLRLRRDAPRYSDCSRSAVAPAASRVQTNAPSPTRRQTTAERPTSERATRSRSGARPTAGRQLVSRRHGPGVRVLPPGYDCSSRASAPLRSRWILSSDALALGSGCSRRATHSPAPPGITRIPFGHRAAAYRLAIAVLSETTPITANRPQSEASRI